MAVAWLLVPLFFTIETRAGHIALNEAQLMKLRQLIKSDAEAAGHFNKIKSQADGALADKPNPIKTIQSEGRLRTDPVKIRTQQSMADMAKMEALGWAFAVTGDRRYAEKTRDFVTAWAATNVSKGDPIDDTGLERAFMAYDLARAAFTAQENAAVQKWLRQVADAEMSHARKGKISSYNNWNSHRLKIIGLAGYLLNNAEIIKHAIEGYRSHIKENLRPDGSSFDFHERDALHYHCYDLDPLLTLAAVARDNGVDLYGFKSAKGASLGHGVRFLIPYCTGEKTHAEFTHSKVGFDRKRAESGDKHYEAGRPFNPKSGAHTLELAAAFDRAFVPVYFKATGRKTSPFPSWQFVLNEVRTAR